MIFDMELGSVELHTVPASETAKAVRNGARKARRLAAEVSGKVLASKDDFLKRFRKECASVSPEKAVLSFEVTSCEPVSLAWTYEVSLAIGDANWTLFCDRSSYRGSVRWSPAAEPAGAWQPFGNGTLDSLACLSCSAGFCLPAIHSRPGALDKWVQEVARSVNAELSEDVRVLLERMGSETLRFEETEAFLSARRAYATSFVREAIRHMSGMVGIADRDSVVEAVDMVVARSVLES